MRRVVWCLLIVGLALASTAPAHAGAGVSRKKAMWGPVFKDGVSQFPIYADLGVGIWQVTVPWNSVAPERPVDPANPADPAYRWPTEVDAAVAEGRKHGIQVLVMLIGAPPWANGGRAWNWAPSDPLDFASFAGAAARRWPAVRHWMVWSEPSKAQNFQPLDEDQNRTLRGFRLRGPRKYAQILDASYAALKQVNRANLVIGGNTFTLGTIRPRWYIPALKLPNGRRPRMDLFGHNPFTLREPNLKHRPMPGGYADFSDLDTLAMWVDKAFPRKRGKRLRFFLSEFSLPTDHTNHEFNFFVDRKTQARWLTKALRISRDWTRIYSFGYLGLYDDALLPNGDQVERGLITRDGVRKPAYAAFKAG